MKPRPSVLASIPLLCACLTLSQSLESAGPSSGDGNRIGAPHPNAAETPRQPRVPRATTSGYKLLGGMNTFRLNDIRPVPGVEDLVKNQGMAGLYADAAKLASAKERFTQTVASRATLAQAVNARRPRTVPDVLIWGVVQAEKGGSYHWDFADIAVKAAQDKGLEMVATLAPLASWDQPNTPVNPNAYPDSIWWGYKTGGNVSDLASFKTFATAAVERYDGDGISDMPGLTKAVKYYEIDNEPETPDSAYSKSGTKYLETLKAAYEAIKAACADCKVVTGGSVGIDKAETKTFWNALAAAGGFQYINVLNWHYNVERDGANSDTTTYEDHLSYWKTLMTGAGANVPMWITEIGTYAGTPIGSSGKTLSEQTEAFQAAWYIKYYTLGVASGVETFFPDLADSWQATPGASSMYNDLDTTQKRVYVSAQKKMASLIDGYTGVQKLATGQYLFTVPATASNYVEANASTRQVMIAWGSGGLASGALSGNVTVTDVSGNSQTVNASSITLTSSPVFIEPVASTPSATISLNRSSLRFAAVGSGGTWTANTWGQTVTITQSGTGTVNWSAGGNQSWISVSPASGTGSGSFTVSVSSTGAPATGTASGTVTVTATGATNSPQTVQVDLTVYSATGVTGPFGSIDTPANGAAGATGSLAVTGWALDDVEVTKVQIYRARVASEGSGNPLFLGDAVLVSGARPDIEQANPTLPCNYRAGWGYLLLTNMLPGQGNGTYTLYVYAEDRHGGRTLLGTRTITCTNATATKPFGAIDTPAQGETISGSAYANFGWVLTPLPKSIPVNGSTIQVYIDGVAVGTVNYNNYRSDIATLFPGLANSNGAIGLRTIDTTAYANGVHTIQWVGTDDAGASEGIGSRYFTNQNSGGSIRTAVRSETAVGDPGSGPSAGLTCLRPGYGGPPELQRRRKPRPTDVGDLAYRRGYDEQAPFEALDPREAVLAIDPLERVQIWLGDSGSRAAAFRGYLRAGRELRPLPIGSTLDPGTGLFSWQPGVGFFGRYELVFERTNRDGGHEQVRVLIVIR